jgi:hypothetical protein
MPANLSVGRDLTIRCKIENGWYYCAFGRSNRIRAVWSGDNSISCGRVARASWTSTRRRGPRCWPSSPNRSQCQCRNSPPYRNRPTNHREHIAEVGLQRRSGRLHCMYACIDESKVRMQALLSCSDITHSNPCPWTEIGLRYFRREVPKNLYRLGSRRT